MINRCLLIVTLMLGGIGTTRAVPENETAAVELAPAVGRPDHFNGAVGIFRVSTHAEPVELQAEDPLTFTISVFAIGPVQQAPQRPNLANFPAFANSFYVANSTEIDVRHPNKSTWEFDYHLRPKSQRVNAVPSFPFVYYRPTIFPPSRGYQTIFPPSLPLTVEARSAVKASDIQGGPPLQPAPAFVYQAAKGASVLRHEGLGSLPGLAILVVLFLLPPLGCFGWYVVWRRLYPDAARRAKRWSARATRQALHALSHVDKDSAVEEGSRTAAIMSQYLRRRLELTTEEPTPAEVGSHLRGRKIPPPLVEQTERFFQACDAARFVPDDQAEMEDLTVSATKLILALEEEL